MIIVSRNLEMHMEQAMRSNSVDKSIKAWLNQTKTITINSDHNEHSHKE